MHLKQKAHAHFLQLANEKIASLQAVLAGIKESAANETKSTAGDKHETALAMLQIEEANTRQQLQQVIGQKDILQKINPAIATVSVVNGSLIQTGKGYLFMSAALGKANLEGHEVTALSAQSPLGKKLMGLAAGAVVEINNSKYVILNIF